MAWARCNLLLVNGPFLNASGCQRCLVLPSRRELSWRNAVRVPHPRKSGSEPTSVTDEELKTKFCSKVGKENGRDSQSASGPEAQNRKCARIGTGTGGEKDGAAACNTALAPNGLRKVEQTAPNETAALRSQSSQLAFIHGALSPLSICLTQMPV